MNFFGNYYHSNILLQGPCEFLDELISTILRCLGLQQDSPPPPTTTTTTDDVVVAYTNVTTTIPSCSTTTVTDNGGEEEGGSEETTITTSVASSGVVVIVPSSTTVIDNGENGEAETTCPTTETPDVGGGDGDVGGGSASQPGEGDYFPPIDTVSPANHDLFSFYDLFLGN
ncbi:uncharacterized protein LOC110696758 [Chenopodium quinoa]|uniref:uncharacterized protein LOC110696758 n=1 Tax=Chenopodium quinoa TaxID=63459 RepID=UPI000B77FE72|nr:uncharacterized protein LOC110696758 [Chenopodium quinoa]